MSPLIGIFVITLLSSILYNKFDANSRTTTTRKNAYYSFEKSNAQSARRASLKDEKQSSEFLDEQEDGFAFENISELDVCIFTVIAGNQKFCKEKTDENLHRLTLLMMSCHTASEENKFPKCTKEKTFSECISSLNTADLETFKNVKKRALTVCQEVSQQLFMINSQRRAQALLETAQLHSSVMTSFKDNQQLLENITSQTLIRLRAQRVAFMKDMRLFKKYFTKNESLFIEAAQAHLTLLSRHKEIIGGLENDVNVLTEGFLQSLETMQDNFTAFSVKIFEKHSEIMANLNRVENTADKILRQLEIIEEYDYTVTLKNAFNWIMANLRRYHELICIVLSSFLIIYGFILRTKILKWIKFVLIVSVIGGIFLQYEYVGLLIAALFVTILGETFIWCFTFSTNNGRIEATETEINSMGHGSVFGMQEDKTGETSGESCTLNDSVGYDNGNRDNVRSTTSSTIAVTESTTRDSRGTASGTESTTRDSRGTASGTDSTTRDSRGTASVTESTTRDSRGTASVTESTTRDSSCENYKGSKMEARSASVTAPAENTSSESMDTSSVSSIANENEIANNQFPGDSMVPQGTMVGCETRSPATEPSGAIMGIEVQNCRDNMVQRNYCSTQGDFVVQSSMQTRSMGRESISDFKASLDLNELQGSTRGKSVQTTTICDSEVQTGPGNDMAIQTSTQCDSEVQTGASEDISVQTSMTNETSVQTNTDKVIGVQTSTRGDIEVQTDTNIDAAVQTSTRGDREVQTGTGDDIAVQVNSKGDNYSQTGLSSGMGIQTSSRGDSQVQTDIINDISVQTRTKGDSQVQTATNGDRHTQTDKSSNLDIQTRTRGDSNLSSRGNMPLEVRTSSNTGIHTRSRSDSSLQTGTCNNIRVQPNRNLVVWSNENIQEKRGITYDFGVPHEPLGIQDETTGSIIPRQSGIIVNIGDNFSNSRRQPSSRTTSPFEVVTGDIRRSSGTYEDTGGNTVMDMSRLRRGSPDTSGEAGTSEQFSSIQVGVQLNRTGSSGEKRECGLMTLQGTPCRRRVSAGRCYIHRYSRQ